MSALKLETFELPQSGQSPLNQLRSDILERERNEAYACGFKDGVNVTKDAVNAEHNQLLAAILEAVSDAQISRQEAGALAVRSLTPLVDALIGHLAPALAESQFPLAVTNTVAKARQKDGDANMRLRVAPNQVDAIQALCADQPFSLAVAGDSQLSPLEAHVDWADGSDVVNLDEFLDDLNTILSEFHLLTEEDRNERDRNAG